jgi:hypothetical protein
LSPPTKLSCPACGFQVFNRRYSKCEQCAAELPSSLLYTVEERAALLESEAQEVEAEMARARAASAKATAEAEAESQRLLVILAAAAIIGGNS